MAAFLVAHVPLRVRFDSSRLALGALRRSWCWRCLCDEARMTMARTHFEEVARMSDLPDGGTRQVDVGGVQVGLFRAGENVYAIGDVCTHQEAYLTEGEWEPDELEVECPLHGSRFDVCTGAVRILPATKPAVAYEVKLEDDVIFVGPPIKRVEE